MIVDALVVGWMHLVDEIFLLEVLVVLLLHLHNGGLFKINVGCRT